MAALHRVSTLAEPIKTIVGDPRLCVQMATLAAAPRLATRLFALAEIHDAAG